MGGVGSGDETVESLHSQAVRVRREAAEIRRQSREIRARHAARTSRPSPSLSEREAEVLSLLGRGMTNRAIAATLRIAPDTARHHVAAVYRKLGVRTRLNAALIARLGEAPVSSRPPTA